MTPTFAAVVLGERPGFLAVAFGYDPHHDRAGKYAHREWIERRYPWPASHDELSRDVEQILAAGERVDVYVCPAVRFTDDRRKGSALPPMVCWVDLDTPPSADQLLAKLDPFTVDSGTDGHRHVYLPLTAPVDLGTHARLNRALANRLGGDAKWSDEALLRLPATYNHKADPPVLVQSRPWAGRVWEPTELAVLLGIDLTATAAPKESVAVATEPVPQPLPDRVQRALDHTDTADRSAAHHRLVGACHDAGLTVGQTLTVVSGYGPSWEKYGERLADEVARSWTGVHQLTTGSGADRMPWDPPESIAKNAKTPLPASRDREPVALWSMVDAVAASYQVPRDMPFLLIVAILATSVGGRRRVRVAQDWSEVLALYTVVALPSGEKKSPVLAAVAAPLLVVEEQLRQEAAPIVAIEKARYDLRSAAVEKIKRTGKSDDATIADLDGAVRELEQTVVPAMPRLLADDSTPEALARLMAQQDGRLGVLSAEAGLFAILAGRYSNAIPNLDLVLKAWSGDQCRVDRISRDALILTEPVLSIGLAVQPDLLAGLAETKHFRGAGLLARFLLSLPTSRVGTRRSEDSVPIPEEVAHAYGRAVQKLARSVRTAEQTSEIRLSEGARKILDEFRDDLEPRLRPERGDLAHVADWANKLPGQLVRIAALFTLFTAPDTAEIAETGMRQAIELAPYFIGHALDAFELMSGRRSPWEPARVVLAWIQRKKLTAFSVRQAWRELSGQAWVTETDDIREAVTDLEDLGWVRPQPQPQEKHRGRPSQRYDVNPAAHHESFGNFGNATGR